MIPQKTDIINHEFNKEFSMTTQLLIQRGREWWKLRRF